MTDFEKASRLKLRFNTAKGDITVEDLWDLKLESRNGFDLESVAQSLNRAVKRVVRKVLLRGEMPKMLTLN